MDIADKLLIVGYIMSIAVTAAILIKTTIDNSKAIAKLMVAIDMITDKLSTLDAHKAECITDRRNIRERIELIEKKL